MARTSPKPNPRTPARGDARTPARIPGLSRVQAIEVAREVERQVADLRAELRREIESVRERTVENRATLVVFSGEIDRMVAALTIATGAAAAGMEVSIFFTFWGLAALKKGRALKGKRGLEKAFSAVTPASLAGLPSSRMNFGGLGASVLKKMMKDKDVASAQELFDLARESGVRMVACSMSMDVMGVGTQELIDGVEVGGVTTYLGDAADSRLTLFV